MDVSPKTTRGTDSVFSEIAPLVSGEVYTPMACQVLPPTRPSPGGCGGAPSGVLHPATISAVAARHPAKDFFMVLLIYAECFWSRVPRAPKKAFAHRSTSCSMTWLYIADMRSFIASGLFFKPQVACNMAFLMSSIS